MDTGWLLEDRDTSREVKYLTLRPELPSFWTTDANLALRFCRKQDAEDFANYFAPIDGEGSKPVEHRWD